MVSDSQFQILWLNRELLQADFTSKLFSSLPSRTSSSRKLNLAPDIFNRKITLNKSVEYVGCQQVATQAHRCVITFSEMWFSERRACVYFHKNFSSSSCLHLQATCFKLVISCTVLPTSVRAGVLIISDGTQTNCFPFLPSMRNFPLNIHIDSKLTMSSIV